MFFRRFRIMNKPVTILLACFFIVSGFHYAAAEEQPTLIKDGDAYRLEYTLEVDEESGFWTNLRDAIRAGQIARVTHQVDMAVADRMFGGRVAQTKAEKYVSYNLFENTYAYGTSPEDMRQTTQLSQVKNFLFSLSAPNFVPTGRIETATLYNIRVRLRLDESLKGSGGLGLDAFFGQKITREFSHVAR